MAMNFGEHVSAIQKMLGDNSGQTKAYIQQWINDARNYLWELIPGNYKEKTDYLSTTASYSTGTVDITNGSTAVAGTSTVWTSAMANRFIQFGDDPWYHIASVTDATNLVLSDAYLGTTDTDATYTLHTYRWSMASDVQRLLQVTVESETNWRALDIIDRLHFHDLTPAPLRWDEGTPEVAFLDEEDSSGNMQLGIYPPPSSATLVRYRYEKTPTDLSTDAATIDIPGADMAIQYHALVRGFTIKGRQDQQLIYANMFERELERLMQSVRRVRQVVWRRQDHSDASGRSRFINMGANWPRTR